jgi:hypothetical protein
MRSVSLSGILDLACEALENFGRRRSLERRALILETVLYFFADPSQMALFVSGNLLE